MDCNNTQSIAVENEEHHQNPSRDDFDTKRDQGISNKGTLYRNKDATTIPITSIGDKEDM